MPTLQGANLAPFKVYLQSRTLNPWAMREILPNANLS